MESKFIIFVVLATLAQSSNVFAADYGLTTEQLSNFTQITSGQEAGLQAAYDAFDPFFTVAAKYAAELIYGLEATTDDSTENAGTMDRTKDAIDYSVEAMSISVGVYCSTIETIRTDSYADFERLFSLTENAMSLALAGNYSANRAQIETYQSQIQENLLNTSARFYKTLIDCRGTTDQGELSVIETVQGRTGKVLVHLVNAIFNVIKVLADAITTGSADVTLINSIENFRSLAHNALRSDFEYKFSGLKAIFLARLLNQTKIISGLFAIQHAYSVSHDEYQQVSVHMGEIIEASLQGISLGLNDAGENDYSTTNFSHAQALAAFQDGADTVLTAVADSNPEAASLVETRRNDVRDVLAILVDNYVTAAVAARSANTDEIDTNLSEAHTNAATFTNYIFEVIRNGKTWGNATEAEMTKWKAQTLDVAELYVDALFGEIQIVAEAAAAGTVTADNYAALANMSSQGLAAIDDYTSLVARGETQELASICGCTLRRICGPGQCCCSWQSNCYNDDTALIVLTSKGFSLINNNPQAVLAADFPAIAANNAK